MSGSISVVAHDLNLSAMIVGAVIFALPIIILAPTGKEKKLCDQAVSTLFTTTDAIELQRAMFSNPPARL
jgi:hypothetical protein